MHSILKCAISALVASLLVSTSAFASGSASYHVTITNITNSINFTPILVASHRRKITVFELGTEASVELYTIAESGDVGPMTTTLNANPRVIDVQNSGGLLGPGESVTVIVDASYGARRISLASMMLPTNDGFIGLNSVRVPRHGKATYFSPGYDAGSEPNDELCEHIPGPTCGNEGGLSPGNNPDDEGYVHIHRGMHGSVDLDAAVYDWRNPVAKITVKRIRHH